MEWRRGERLFVWTGGLLFVSSLAGTAWWYAFVLGKGGPSLGWTPLVFDACLFSIFALHHSLFARPSVKSALARAVPERLLRSTYVWAASILLIAVCFWWRPIGGALYDVRGWRTALHAVVQLAGLWFIAQSVRAIDALALAGIRAPSAEPSGAAAAKGLQSTGPYRVVRHPLYLGWMLVVFGAAHLTIDRLAFASISSSYLVIAIPWEERSLSREFGAEYARYKQRVRWRVLPYLY